MSTANIPARREPLAAIAIDVWLALPSIARIAVGVVVGMAALRGLGAVL